MLLIGIKFLKFVHLCLYTSPAYHHHCTLPLGTPTCLTWPTWTRKTNHEQQNKVKKKQRTNFDLWQVNPHVWQCQHTPISIDPPATGTALHHSSSAICLHFSSSSILYVLLSDAPLPPTLPVPMPSLPPVVPPPYGPPEQPKGQLYILQLKTL